MKLELTDSPEDVFYITNHPDIADDIADDKAAALSDEEYKEVIVGMMPNYLHIKVLDDDGNLAGMFGCHDEVGSLEVHINMLKKYRGQFAVDAALAMKDLIFQKTKYTKIITKVPSKFFNVFKFVSNVGCKLEYMLEEAHIKGGQKYDVYCFSLDKE